MNGTTIEHDFDSVHIFGKLTSDPSVALIDDFKTFQYKFLFLELGLVGRCDVGMREFLFINRMKK